MLSIYNSNGEYNGQGILEIFAKMIYPTDENAQNLYKAWSLSLTIGALAETYDEKDRDEWKDIFMMSIDGYLGGVHKLPDLLTLDRKSMYKRISKGIVSGVIATNLCAILGAQESSSVNKAIFITSKILHKSERSIRYIWNEFKHVSHFWGGFNVTFDPKHNDPFGRIISASLIEEKDALTMLNCAHRLRCAMLSVVPHGAKFPLFNSDDLEEIDSSLIDDAIEPTFKQNAANKTQRGNRNSRNTLKDVLKDYKAPKSA